MQITIVINKYIEEYCNCELEINSRELIDFIKEKLIEYNYLINDKINNKIENQFKKFVKINNDYFDILSKSPLIIKSKKTQNQPSKIIENKNFILHERDLHYHLEKFLLLKNVISKTIFHEKSVKDINLQWLHPDMVGYSKYSDHSIDVLNLSNKLNINIVDLYSYEIKRELNFSNLRKYFFQAVSNSSWANYGYLVVETINLFDFDLMNEIQRLNDEFRIGLIKLDTNNHFNSKIIINSKKREIIDRNLINIMVNKNPDFKDYVSEIYKN